MAIFPCSFFPHNTGQETVFYDILERKNAFLSYNNKNIKKSKNWNSSKRLTHGFGPKGEIFHLFLGNIGQENVLYDILERKNAFLSFKNKKFKNSKNWHCSKGVNSWFWSKNGHFSNLFFFRQYRSWKCLLRYSRTKKRLSRLQKQEVQTFEKLAFFQRG